MYQVNYTSDDVGVDLSDARQPEVDFFHSWAVILPKILDKSSL